MEQHKIIRAFSEQSVNVEMERGDIGSKKNKKIIGGADSCQNLRFHHKKNEETPVHVDYFRITFFFW